MFSNLLAVLHIGKANKIHPMSDTCGGKVTTLNSTLDLCQRYKAHLCIALNCTVSFDLS